MKKFIVRVEKEENIVTKMAFNTPKISITDTNSEGDIRLEIDISSKYLTEIVRFQLDLIEESDVYVSFKIKKQQFEYRINHIQYEANERRVSLILEGRLYGWLRSHDDK